MPSISPQQALVDYLALGHDRSLRNLKRKYDETKTVNAPSFQTLAEWSRRHHWQRRAEEHDEFVGKRLFASMQKEAVRRGFDRVQALMDAAEACLSDALQIRITTRGATAQDTRA